MRDSDLRRLFRAGATSSEEPNIEMPFGFDKRIVATWRGQRPAKGAELWEFARLFRRLAVAAVVVTAGAGSAAWWQLQENDELDLPTTNAYAIADRAIETGTWR